MPPYWGSTTSGQCCVYLQLDLPGSVTMQHVIDILAQQVASLSCECTVIIYNGAFTFTLEVIEPQHYQYCATSAILDERLSNPHRISCIVRHVLATGLHGFHYDFILRYPTSIQQRSACLSTFGTPYA